MVSILNKIWWSPKNGLIRVTNANEVLAGGVKQTSARYPQMWADALSHADIKNSVRDVLMLGLAGGGAVPAIHTIFPNAKVTAVEYDENMIAIAKKLKLNEPFPFPTVILKDAKEALKDMSETYDLIVVDIFDGIEPSPLVADDVFWKSVASRLNPQGVVVLNVADSYHFLDFPRDIFPYHKTWQFDRNTFGIFWR